MKKPKSPTLRTLQWSASAVADLEAILDWFDTVSVDRSLEFEQELLAAVEPLRNYPRMGRVPTDYDWRGTGLDDLREVLVWDFRVGYVVEARAVEIVYLVHSKRRFPPVG